ncbi:hypothetical protein [Paraburkholderia sacchari]|uniref:hypothetical protein n=1 Tax=Paraburkholderia sacchari TaxID=159450 RepID=UPI003CC82806
MVPGIIRFRQILALHTFKLILKGRLRTGRGALVIDAIAVVALRGPRSRLKGNLHSKAARGIDQFDGLLGDLFRAGNGGSLWNQMIFVAVEFIKLCEEFVTVDVVCTLNLILADGEDLQESDRLLRGFIGSHILNDGFRFTVLRHDEWLSGVGKILDNLCRFAIQVADRLHVIGDTHEVLRYADRIRANLVHCRPGLNEPLASVVISRRQPQSARVIS